MPYNSRIILINSEIMFYEDGTPIEGILPVLTNFREKNYSPWIFTRRLGMDLAKMKSYVHNNVPNHGVTCFYSLRKDLGNNRVNDVPTEHVVEKIRGTVVAFFDISFEVIQKTKEKVPSYLFNPIGIKPIENVGFVWSLQEIRELQLP